MDIYIYRRKCREAINRRKREKRLGAYLERLIPDYLNRFASLFCDNCNDNLDMILRYQYHYYPLLVWQLMIYLKDFFPVLNNVHIPNVHDRKISFRDVHLLVYIIVQVDRVRSQVDQCVDHLDLSSRREREIKMADDLIMKCFEELDFLCHFYSSTNSTSNYHFQEHFLKGNDILSIAILSTIIMWPTSYLQYTTLYIIR